MSEELPLTPLVPATPEVPDDSFEPDNSGQPATSDYFKISRALSGDDWWSQRLEMALEINGLENSRANRLSITKAVVDFIDCTLEGDVNTERVTDEMIDAAIGELPVTIPVSAPEA